MSVVVIETSDGLVLQVIQCQDLDVAKIVAKEICKTNGIAFEGDLSCDDQPQFYSVQICPLEKN